MKIEFTKMHGLGNDFVIIDAISQDVQLSAEQIASICHRNTGVGCDQFLLVEKATDAQYDFFYRIYNADGSEAQQCGNGARCFYTFIKEQGLSDKDKLNVQLINGEMQLESTAEGLVRVSLPTPQFKPSALPFISEQESARYTLDLDGNEIEIGAVSMGNPHAVTLLDDIESERVCTEGPLIEAHSRFPERVNAGFMQIIDRQNIKLRVYERGAGETLACGSGACAAVAIGQRWNLLDSIVNVQLPGGSLTIEWQGDENNLYMIGPSAIVFKGILEL